MNLPSIHAGQRGVLVGRTGNGKTTLARAVMDNSPLHWIVLDCKNDKSFDDYKHYDLGDKLNFSGKLTVIRPAPHYLADRKSLDAWIFELSETYENIGLFIDELLYVTHNSTAGPGLVGWLTRGRSRKQSFLGCTQRPARISMFIFTECDVFINLGVNHVDDVKRLEAMTSSAEFAQKPPRFHFHVYDVAEDSLKKFKPVPQK